MVLAGLLCDYYRALSCFLIGLFSQADFDCFESGCSRDINYMYIHKLRVFHVFLKALLVSLDKAVLTSCMRHF